VLSERSFWILAPSNFTAASTGTALVFFQFELGQERGWSPAFMAASFSGYAIASALGGLGIGFLVDRWSARRLFPLYLVPYGLALLAFTQIPGPAAHTVLVTGLGLSAGLGGTLLNASLAELHGTARLGTVRSVYAMAMVFSTAVGPALFGALRDLNWQFNALALLSLTLVVLATLNATRLRAR
jgi:MFS family permease